MATYINLNETAKIIRQELKAAFPGVKFSVRSEKYSMGCHINVSWTDGPSTKAVAAITDLRYGTGFDGMTDSSTSHDSEWNGQIVHFSGSRPSLNRTISPKLEATCLAAWNALTADERFALTSRHDFPQFAEARPGLQLAVFL